MLKLSGTAFITGAGSGIGRGVALAFARYGVNRLALLDQKPDNLEETRQQLETSFPKIKTALIPADVTDEPSIQEAVRKTTGQFDRIDYGVNCAGVTLGTNMTHEMELADWKKTIDVNLTGVWICQKQLLRQMLSQEYVMRPPILFAYRHFANGLRFIDRAVSSRDVGILLI